MNSSLKPLFATYLNMARHNAYITLLHINKILKFQMPKAVDKDGKTIDHELGMQNIPAISKISDGATVNNEQYRLISQHYRHFPFLKIIAEVEMNQRLYNESKNNQTECGAGISEKNYEMKVDTPAPKDIKEVITNIVYVLNRKRNEACHSQELTEKYETDKEYQVVRYLNMYLKAGARTINERFRSNDNKNPCGFFTSSRNIENKYKDEKGNEAVRYILNPYYHYSITDINTGLLNDNGLILLACLFLEKRYASMFIDQHGSFYERDKNRYNNPIVIQQIEKENHIIREIFSVYRTRLPKERLTSERQDISLALDMFNELKKCPKELFEHLTESDQKKFRIKLGDESINEQTVNDEVLLKRNNERFPYFALKFIDSLELFNNIRFQVNFGKYRVCLKEYKKCIDGEERMRVIQKPLNCFMRVDDVEDKRKNSWMHKEEIMPFEEIIKDEVTQFPYITDTMAHYLLDEDRIGLMLKLIPDEPYNPFFDTMPIIETSDNRKNRVKLNQPTCWLSKFDLPALIFHTLTVNPQSTESVIANHVKSYKTLFKDIKEKDLEDILQDSGDSDPISFIEKKYGIKRKDIPDKIREYIKGRSTFEGLIVLSNKKINRMKEQTQRMINCFSEDVAKLGTKNNRIGTKKYTRIKPGRLASFLAKDILMFQPTKGDGSDKLTGLNYRVLQTNIAQYNAMGDQDKRSNFKQLFEKANFINGGNPHPFLNNVFISPMPDDCVSFYSKYMDARLAYLNSKEIGKAIKKIAQGKTSQDVPYFLHHNRSKWQKRDVKFYKELADRYLEQPIQLPRGLFEDSLRENHTELILDTAKMNSAYIIAQYFNNIKDNAQSMYNFKRNYKFFDVLNFDNYTLTDIDTRRAFDYDSNVDTYLNTVPIKIKTISDARNRVKKIETANKKNETNIPVNEEDLWISKNKMPIECSKDQLKYMYQSMNDTERKLRRYMIEDMVTFMMAKEVIKAIGVDTSNIKLSDVGIGTEKDILSKQTPLSITLIKDDYRVTVEQKDLKIKNFGDFMRLVYDKRVKTLIPHIKSDVIQKEDLERELTTYDLQRIPIFRSVLEFEQEFDTVIKDRSSQGLKSSFRDIVESSSLSNEDREIAIHIRNKFSHNEYVDTNITMNSKLPDIAKSSAKLFKETITKK